MHTHTMAEKRKWVKKANEMNMMTEPKNRENNQTPLEYNIMEDDRR